MALKPSIMVAQWQSVAPNLLGTRGRGVEGAAISYKDGLVWAGYQDLFLSRDSGSTWTKLPRFIEPLNWITDIQFLDRDTGLVTSYFAIYLTTDGGATWSDILELNEGASACFAGSSNNIIVSEFAPGTVFVSSDRGKNWRSIPLDEYEWHALYHKGIAYIFTASDTPKGTLYTSTDRGQTWNGISGTTSEDCYSFAIDSCQNIIYLIHEAAEDQFSTTSAIMTSTDLGAHWQSKISRTRPFFSGATALGYHTIYCPTFASGVFRSTDQAATWKTIGGPDCQIDGTSICAINDNLLLVIDPSGGIWRTVNSGGDSIVNVYTPPSISTYELFAKDTVSPCESSSATVLFFPYSGTTCNTPRILSQQIEGPDAAYYTLIHTSSGSFTQLDSDVVLFQPTSSRTYTARLDITLSDGTVWQIALSGRGSDSPNVTLSAEAIMRDVIGDGAILTVHASSSVAQPFELTISFDTTTLVYEGTYDTAGKKLDAASLPAGLALIHVDGSNALSTNPVTFFSHFAFYPSIETCGAVTFGPGHFLPDTNACGSISAINTQVCWSGDICGTPLLSGFLRYDKAPLFRITPNPTNALIQITSATLVNLADIDILDALGRVELQTESNLGPMPFTLDLSALSSGPKFVRVATAEGIRVIPVLLSR